MVKNIVKFISEGGDKNWSEKTINNYGYVVSRILACLLKEKSDADILQLLQDKGYKIEGDPKNVANNIKRWLGVDEEKL